MRSITALFLLSNLLLCFSYPSNIKRDQMEEDLFEDDSLDTYYETIYETITEEITETITAPLTSTIFEMETEAADDDTMEEPDVTVIPEEVDEEQLAFNLIPNDSEDEEEIHETDLIEEIESDLAEKEKILELEKNKKKLETTLNNLIEEDDEEAEPIEKEIDEIESEIADIEEHQQEKKLKKIIAEMETEINEAEEDFTENAEEEELETEIANGEEIFVVEETEDEQETETETNEAEEETETAQTENEEIDAQDIEIEEIVETVDIDPEEEEDIVEVRKAIIQDETDIENEEGTGMTKKEIKEVISVVKMNLSSIFDTFLQKIKKNGSRRDYIKAKKSAKKIEHDVTSFLRHYLRYNY